MNKLFGGRCRCTEGRCFEQFNIDEVKYFLDEFEAKEKRDQDSILYLALQDDGPLNMKSHTVRREFHFLGRYMKRACFEALVGISSHRTDKLGAFDLRYGTHSRASPLRASIDTFCMILYNSVAEPLPNKHLRVNQKDKINFSYFDIWLMLNFFKNLYSSLTF